MPKLTASKEEIKGQPTMPEGLYTVKLKGFKPKLSKKKDSVNLNPELEVINHPDHNNRRVFDSLNTKAKFAWKGFINGFGLVATETPDGGIEFPGEFLGPENDPEKWNYTGPLLGLTAQVYLIEIPVIDPVTGGPGEYQGNTTQNRVKYYVDATKTQSASA